MADEKEKKGRVKIDTVNTSKATSSTPRRARDKLEKPKLQSFDAVAAAKAAKPSTDFSEFSKLSKDLYGVAPDVQQVPEGYLQNLFATAHLATVTATFPALHIEYLLDQSQELLSRAVQD